MLFQLHFLICHSFFNLFRGLFDQYFHVFCTILYLHILKSLIYLRHVFIGGACFISWKRDQLTFV